MWRLAPAQNLNTEVWLRRPLNCVGSNHCNWAQCSFCISFHPLWQYEYYCALPQPSSPCQNYLVFVQEKVIQRQLVVSHVPSRLQYADTMPKPLSPSHFNDLCAKLTSCDTSPSIDCDGILKKSLYLARTTPRGSSLILYTIA